jgi:hypothetical protein
MKHTECLERVRRLSILLDFDCCTNHSKKKIVAGYQSKVYFFYLDFHALTLLICRTFVLNAEDLYPHYDFDFSEPSLHLNDTSAPAICPRTFDI